MTNTVVTHVHPLSEVRKRLSGILARFRLEGAAAEPVAFGSHRKPEAILLPYEAYERYEELSRQHARLDSALAAAQSVQAELPGPFSPDHDREVAAYVDGEISAAELYRRTVADRAVEPGPVVPVKPGDYLLSRVGADGEMLAVDDFPLEFGEARRCYRIVVIITHGAHGLGDAQRPARGPERGSGVPIQWPNRRAIRGLVLAGRGSWRVQRLAEVLPGVRVFCGYACRDVAQERVAVDADHVVALLPGHDWHVVAQVTPQDAAGHLDVRALGDEHIHIAEYRVSVDDDLGGSALDPRQVDGHVTEERDGDQLILDIPGLRALAVPAPFNDRVQGEEPPAALARSGPLHFFRVAVHESHLACCVDD